ncbi:CDP-alcohol phosphatidyltransferase-domain-containing protein [Phlebopus sp. FC_14]|nr:CDP-alcohol phosphatidyltransferase-domain-containing protein [Phlebopus sp. FC_14]
MASTLAPRGFVGLSRIRALSFQLQCRRSVDKFPSKPLQSLVTRSLLPWRTFTSTPRLWSARHPSKPNRGQEHNTDGEPLEKIAIRENIYTLPNLLTVSRILACPVLGWSILHDDFYLATGLLVYAGLSDIVDGFLARRFNMRSVLGTILDPAADKTLMTTLTVTLAMKGLLPHSLAAVIIGRDVLLSISAFYIRYTSLPAPKTFTRYWDFSIPSAEVRPTTISKFNTAAQLALMFVTTVAPIAPAYVGLYLPEMQLMVAVTTIWSGLSYVFSKDAVRIVSETRKRNLPP